MLQYLSIRLFLENRSNQELEQEQAEKWNQNHKKLRPQSTISQEWKMKEGRSTSMGSFAVRVRIMLDMIWGWCLIWYDDDNCTENDNNDNIECGFAMAIGPHSTSLLDYRNEDASQLALLPQFLSQPGLEKVNLDFYTKKFIFHRFGNYPQEISILLTASLSYFQQS